MISHHSLLIVFQMCTGCTVNKIQELQVISILLLRTKMMFCVHKADYLLVFMSLTFCFSLLVPVIRVLSRKERVTIPSPCTLFCPVWKGFGRP